MCYSALLLLLMIAFVTSFRSYVQRPGGTFLPTLTKNLRRLCTEQPEVPLTELSRLEIRAGEIVSIEKHPEADSLYVEKIDCGDSDGPRTILSGLVKYCSEEMLQNRKVVVLCNLKPRKLKGIESCGMLLCASNEDRSKVEPISPPEGCANGELMTFEGHLSAPIDPSNRASKAFDRVADDLYVNDEGKATFKGIPMMSSLGPCTSKLIGPIS